MKKLVFAIVMFFVSMVGFSQVKIYEYANKNVEFGDIIPAGAYVLLKDSMTMYRINVEQGALRNMANVFTVGATAYTTFGKITQLKGSSLSVSGDAYVGDDLYAVGSVTASDNIGLTSWWLMDNDAGSGYKAQIYYGGKSSWKMFAVVDTVGKNYKVRLENISDIKIQNKAGNGLVSLLTRDTTGGEATASLAAIQNLSMSGTFTGSSPMRGSAAFTTTETRVAIYIPGATNVDFYLVQPNDITNGSGRPPIGDFCTTYAKTDSLIVQRQAGTTSGLTFDWFRIK